MSKFGKVTAQYESYFTFKNNKNDKNYSYHEYVVYHIYHGNFSANHTISDRSNFVTAYNLFKQRYLGSNMKSKLTEWSTNSNKLLSVIGNYIDDAPKEELDADDPLYSGIIDAENIKDQKTSLFKKIQDLDEWKKLNKIDLPKKEVLFNQQTIKVWFEKNENEVEQNSKQLVHDIKRIWNNLYYQERSILINESTFTHDILLSIIHFISPGFFKRWDQAQSLSAKDQVSYSPFYKDPEPYIDEDKRKLGKL
ncbi:17421_t:CDS:2, partial [Gigaspora margarita]